MIKKFLILTLSLAVIASLQAATPGKDNANRPAYEPTDGNGGNDGDPTNNTNGWVTGDDGFDFGPAAFGAWTLSTVNSAGHFIGDSTNLSSPGANINVNSESFGMFGSGGSTAEAFRSFDSPLEIGQTFSLDMAVNFRNGQKGIDIRNSSNVVLFNFNVGDLGSGDDYTVQFAATGNGSIGNTYSSNTAFHLAFTQTTATGGMWEITRTGGVSDFDSGTYTGVPSNFKLYVNNTGGGAPNDLYANNFSVPEPSTWVAATMTLLACLYLRRRTRKA